MLPKKRTPAKTTGEEATASSVPERSVNRGRKHAPGRIRTFDLGIKSPLLYQLSYGRKASRAGLDACRPVYPKSASQATCSCGRQAFYCERPTAAQDYASCGRSRFKSESRKCPFAGNQVAGPRFVLITDGIAEFAGV
jgi:hypothetical protein